jgi:hypothetical protein
MGADAVTPKALHREHRICTSGIIIFHNQDLWADAHIHSRQRQKFSLNKILVVTEFILAGFHIFQHGIKGAVHHDCTTAPFHSYQKISVKRHESSRDSCMKVQRLILEKMLINKSRPVNCVTSKITRLNTISAFNLRSTVFPVAFNDLEGLQPRVQDSS